MGQLKQDDSQRGENREHTPTSSPNVSIEARMLSCAIDAKENRYVVLHSWSFSTCRHEWQCTHAIQRNNSWKKSWNWTQQYTEKTYGTINMESQWYNYN